MSAAYAYETERPDVAAARRPTQEPRCPCGGRAGPGGECAACKARRLNGQRSGDAAPTARHDFGRVRVNAGGERSRNPLDGPSAEEEVTVDGGDAGTPPAKACEVASAPSYSPTGTIPVTTSGGRKKASFSLAASFKKDAKTGATPSCCEVRQYVKWDKAFHDWRGGPIHSGFPSGATYDTWYEDRDGADKRYGHRSGTHSDPHGSCGDEYKTGTTQDMANGDTYCGKDGPNGAATRDSKARTGHWYFQLKVIDTCNSDAEKASSAEIDIDWSK